MAHSLTLSSYPFPLRLFGLVVLAAGLWMLSIFGFFDLFTNLSGNHHGEVHPFRPSALVVPGFFTLLGLLLTGIRSTTVIDGHIPRIVTTWGFAWFTRQSIQDISAWDQIECGPQERRGAKGKHDVVPVRGLGGDHPYELAAPTHAGPARIIALRVARATGLPIIDHLGERGRLVTADEFAGPAIAAIPDEPHALVAPPETRIRRDDAARGVVIRVPPAPSLFLSLIGMALLCGIFGIWWAYVWCKDFNGHRDHELMYIPLAFALIVVLWILAKWWRDGRFGATIRASNQDGLRSGLTRIPAHDVLSLEVTSENHVHTLRLLTAHREYLLASGQSSADLRYIRALILHHLR